MKKVIFLLVIIVVLYAFAVPFELYRKTPFVDLLQHFLAGIVLGLIWIEINKSKPEKLHRMSIIGFVLLISLMWELFEFLFWKLLPAYSSIFMLNSPTVEDMITDLLAAFMGSLIISRYRDLGKKI